MKRREFLTTSALAGLGAAAAGTANAAGSSARKDLLELRTYHFASAEKQRTFENFLARTAIPALNRAGVKPVGVFKLNQADNPKLEGDSTDLYVLLPHKSADSLVHLIERLADDSWFTSDAAEVIVGPKSSPPYDRFESSLLLSFDGVPHVEVPTKAESRLLQLRVYESHNDERALMKIAMFNVGGELEIFRRVGMDPVFFGQALVGTRLPNLAYMLGFENEAAMKKGWGAFGKDPAWLRLRQDQTYKDTVSRITNLVLRPAKGSQI